MKKAEPISNILKRYKNEWLLIAVDKTDKRTRIPKAGRLVAHSPRQQDLEKTFETYNGHLARIFSGPPLPPNLRAVF